MTTPIDTYIDRCLIDEYADKNMLSGYSLEVSSLSTHEQENFLDYLFEHDPVMQEIATERMQELINNRLETTEVRDKYDAGLSPMIDQNNGEVIWTKRGAA